MITCIAISITLLAAPAALAHVPSAFAKPVRVESGLLAGVPTQTPGVTSFNGDPNGGLPSWPAGSTAADRAMRLGERIEAVPTPHQAELDFLDAWNARPRPAR